MNIFTYVYDLGITLAMPEAWGPLTTKNTQWCWSSFSVMLRPLLLIFFIFCYFLSLCNFFKLLFIVEGSVFVTFCYFFYCL
jgi:hypothetical protein